MDVWYCGTVGLWNRDTLSCSAYFILWMCGTVGLWDCGTVEPCHSELLCIFLYYGCVGLCDCGTVEP